MQISLRSRKEFEAGPYWFLESASIAYVDVPQHKAFATVSWGAALGTRFNSILTMKLQVEVAALAPASE